VRSTAFEIAATWNVMVAMRDGIKLATDVYRPARNGTPVEGKFPVILERTPYTKETCARSEGYLVSRGYIVVLQDVRGRYQSEGHWVPIRDDPNDGFDLRRAGR
jgi:putative CocE/NonD family hydrolase